MVSCLLVASAVVAAGLEYYAKNISSKSALNLIQVSAVGATAKRPLTDAALREIAEVPGVVSVSPWSQMDLSLASTSDWPDPTSNPGALWASPFVTGLVPRAVLGVVPETGPEPGEIILPESIAGGDTRGLIGKQVAFEYTKSTSPGHGEPANIRLRVIAIVDNSVPDLAGPTPAYLAADQFAELRQDSGLANSPGGVETAFVRVADPAHAPKVQADLAGRGFAVSSLAAQVPSLGGLFRLLDGSQSVLMVITVLISLALGGSLGASWMSARTREVGLLKALGWSGKRIGSVLICEYFAMGLVSAISGVDLGVIGSLVATTVVANARLSVLPILPWGVPALNLMALVLLIIPSCVCLGGLISAVRVARIEPDSALREL